VLVTFSAGCEFSDKIKIKNKLMKMKNLNEEILSYRFFLLSFIYFLKKKL
jgi:hypothetical protein